MQQLRHLSALRSGSDVNCTFGAQFLIMIQPLEIIAPSYLSPPQTIEGPFHQSQGRRCLAFLIAGCAWPDGHIGAKRSTRAFSGEAEEARQASLHMGRAISFQRTRYFAAMRIPIHIGAASSIVPVSDSIFDGIFQNPKEQSPAAKPAGRVRFSGPLD